MSKRIVPQRRYFLVEPSGLVAWWSFQLSAARVQERAGACRDKTWEQLSAEGFRVAHIEAHEVPHEDEP